LILAIVFVVLSGIVILGDSSRSVQLNRTIFNVYKSSGISTKIVDDVNALLRKESSKYVSNKAINLYIEEKSEKDEVSDSLDNKLDDLVNFAEFYAS
jgi:preprotein translocase subunit Sec63